MTKTKRIDSTTTPLQAHLASLDACSDARTWAGTKTAREAWETCECADWLLWWVARTDVNSKSDIVRCAAKIARTVAHFNPDPRVMSAIEAAEAWADNPDNAEAAAEAARAEAAAARAEAAAWAAWAAAEAAAEPATNYCDLIRAILKQPWNET